MLLKKGEFAAHRGWKSPGRVSQLIKEGLPVEPSGLIDVEKADTWITARDERVAVRMPAQTEAEAHIEPAAVTDSRKAPEAKEPRPGNPVARLALARAEVAEADCSLKLLKVAEKEGAVVLHSAVLAAERKRAEAEKDAMADMARRIAIAIAGKLGADLGECTVVAMAVAREDQRRRSASARANQMQAEASA